MSKLRNDLLAVDRDVAADLNAPVGTTLSQNVGLGLFGPRRLLFLPMSWFLTVLMWERHHAVRSLYDDHAIPLFPDLMPPSAPPLNPYL